MMPATRWLALAAVGSRVVLWCAVIVVSIAAGTGVGFALS